MSLSEDSHGPPPAKDKFTFLEELTSERWHHADKSLYQHLYSVYSFLKSYSRSEEVCDAGLFHAVYGTEFFEFQSGTITRDIVRGYIGDYAEELVHIFCGLRKGRFQSIVNNTPGWSAQQHLDLCWLEFANAWDHRGPRAVRIREQMVILSEVIPRLEDAKSAIAGS